MAGAAIETAGMDVDTVPASAASTSAAAGAEPAADADAAVGSVGSAAAGADSDDDPVVQECDVYLNRMDDPPEFKGVMYVLQYPLRPVYRCYGDQGELDKVELKEKARRLRFTYKLAECDNYDPDNALSGNASKEQKLTSTVVANPSCSYAVGVMRQGRMVIVPVGAVNQMRPDFEDFEKGQGGRGHRSAPSQEAKAADDSGAEDDAGQASNEVTGTQVRVEFQSNARGKKSETQAPAGQDEADEESWVRLDAYSTADDDAKDVFENHLVWPATAAADAERQNYEVEHEKMQKVEFEDDKEVFLRTLCGQSVPKVQRAAEPGDGLTISALSRMPVQRQIEALLISTQVMRYSVLRKRLPPATLRTFKSDEALIERLKDVAVLSVGNWVVKSELVGFEGPDAWARDFLVLALNSAGHLPYGKVAQWLGGFRNMVPDRTLNEITLGIATRSPDGRVVLKNQPDIEFLRKFPKVHADCKQWWDVHKTHIQQKMKEANQQGQQGRESKQEQQKASAARQKRSKIRDQIRKVLDETAMTFSELKRTIQRNNQQIQIKDEDLLPVLGDMEQWFKIGDLYWCKSTGNAANDKFRAVVHQVFNQDKTVSHQHLLDTYKRVHGEDCKLIMSVLRGFIKQVAKKEGDNWVRKDGPPSDRDAAMDM